MDAATPRPILAALRLLLRVEGKATATALARAAGVPYRRALEVLDANRHLLRHDQRRRGVVVGERVQSTAVLEAINAGRVYAVNGIDYGRDSELTFRGPLFDEMKRGHVCGGIGDSWTQQAVLNRPENVERVRAAGLVSTDDFRASGEADAIWRE